MNKKTAVIAVLILLGVFSVWAAAGGGKVAVLYNGNTQVNRQALHYMGQQFRSLGAPYEFSAVGKPGDIRPGDYDLVLILNTGMTSGVEPVLADFIHSWPDKSRLILITLHRGSRDFRVESFTASEDPLGVDSVSAATLWRSSGFGFLGKGSEVQRMHETWTLKVLELIDQKL